MNYSSKLSLFLFTLLLVLSYFSNKKSTEIRELKTDKIVNELALKVQGQLMDDILLECTDHLKGNCLIKIKNHE